MKKSKTKQQYFPRIISRSLHIDQPPISTPFSKSSKKDQHRYQSKILRQYEKQLKTKSPSFYSNEISHKPYRSKTQKNQQLYGLFQLKKQLADVKNSLSNKILERNHKLQLKMVQLSSIIERKNIQFPPMPLTIPVYMPVPIVPPMNQFFQPNYNDYPPKDRPRNRQISKKHLKKQRALQNIRKFKIAVDAILFTIYLRKFTQKVVKYRAESFTKYLNDSSFKNQTNQLKMLMIQGCKDFFQILLQKQETQFKIQQNDSESVKKEKKLAIRKLVQILIECLSHVITESSMSQYALPIYYFCKHGSTACTQNLLTLQELQHMCVSSKHNYLQAQKNLQKAQIINFIFMKIIIFNFLAQPWKIDNQIFSNKPILEDNILLVSSIFYQILMDIQDDYTVQSPSSYLLGNYAGGKYKILPSISLTLKQGQYRKNQMISGLYNQNYIKHIYKTQKTWIQQKNKLIQIIQTIHKVIVNYHANLIKHFL